MFRKTNGIRHRNPTFLYKVSHMVDAPWIHVKARVVYITTTKPATKEIWKEMKINHQMR